MPPGWLSEAARLRASRVHEGTSWEAARAENLRLQALKDAAPGLKSAPDLRGDVPGPVTPGEPGAAVMAEEMAETEEERE